MATKSVDVSVIERELADRGLLPGDALAVYCVGSMARGWANANSDCDIYVTTVSPFVHSDSFSQAVPLNPPEVRTIVLRVAGIRWEIKYWTAGQVEQMLRKVNEEAFVEGFPDDLTQREELFLERLLSAVAIGDSAWLDECRQAVLQSRFRAALVMRSLNRADSMIRHSVGQLHADPHAAVVSAHHAFRCTVDALLDNVGCHGSRTEKWRVRRVREAQQSSGLEFWTYWSMETMRDLTNDNVESWVKEVLLWCRSQQATISI